MKKIMLSLLVIFMATSFICAADDICSGKARIGTTEKRYTADITGCTYTTQTRTCCEDGFWSDWGKDCPKCREGQCWAYDLEQCVNAQVSHGLESSYMGYWVGGARGTTLGDQNIDDYIRDYYKKKGYVSKSGSNQEALAIRGFYDIQECQKAMEKKIEEFRKRDDLIEGTGSGNLDCSFNNPDRIKKAVFEGKGKCLKNLSYGGLQTYHYAIKIWTCSGSPNPCCERNKQAREIMYQRHGGKQVCYWY